MISGLLLYGTLAVGKLAGMASLRRHQWLLCDRHSWFQAAPTDALQDTAETINQAGSTFVKTCLRKIRKCQMYGEENNNWKQQREQRQSEKDEKEEKEKRMCHSRHWSRYLCCSLWRTPCWSRWIFP